MARKSALAREAALWAKKSARPGADLELDSRRLARGDVFVALPGLTSDGRSFIREAVQGGAAAVVYEERGAAGIEIPAGVPALPVERSAHNARSGDNRAASERDCL